MQVDDIEIRKVVCSDLGSFNMVGPKTTFMCSCWLFKPYTLLTTKHCCVILFQNFCHGFCIMLVLVFYFPICFNLPARELWIVNASPPVGISSSITIRICHDLSQAFLPLQDGYLADFIKRNVFDFDEDHTVVCATNGGGMKFTRRTMAKISRFSGRG